TGSARALLIAALQKRLRRTIVVVVRSNKEVEELQADLEFFAASLGLGDPAVLTIPAIEADPYDGTSPHAELLERRSLALDRAARGDARLVITSISAVAERTVPPDLFRSSELTLRLGEEMPLELIVDLLVANGYVREEPVGSVGEFSLRGGILDVFSPAHEAPHRIEFYGDSVDSIREFDPDTQRSIKRIDETWIVPMRELAVRRQDLMSWAEAAQAHFTDDRFKRDLRARIAHAERGEPFPGWEFLIPLTRPLTSSVFEYFRDAVWVIDEPVEIEQRATTLFSFLQDRFAQADDLGELSLLPEKLFLTSEQLRTGFDGVTRVELRLLGRAAASTDDQFRFSASTSSTEQAADLASLTSGRVLPPLFLFPVTEATPDFAMISQAPPRYQGRVADLAGELKRDTELAARTTLLVMPSLGLCERVREMLGEYQITAELLPTLEPGEREGSGLVSPRIVTVGKLANGFVLAAGSLTVLTEVDVFGDVERVARQRQAPKRPRKQRKAAAFLSDLGDLKVGDYVVHVDHGIGQFAGMTQMATAGASTGNVAAG